jgi:hypothetical protein
MPGINRAPLCLAPPAPVVSPVAHEVAPSVTQPTATLSTKLWGLELCRDLPRVLSSDGIEATRGDLTRVRSFLAEEFPSFGEETLGAQPSAAILDAKRWYLHAACDAIELRHHGNTIGVFVGAPEDWSSYYIRIFAVVQAYQRPALIRRFGRECVFGPLAEHHVERVIADTSPANLAMSRCFTELHFHVTGHQLSDRWGPLVRYTRFLDPACEAAFMRRFAGIAAGGATRNGKEEPP